MRNLGYRPDQLKRPGEVQDTDAVELLRTLPAPPASASATALVGERLDQGILGSCVFNAIMLSIRANHVRQGIPDPKLGSRLFGYYLSRAYHHQTGEDSGTFLRMGYQALNKFGFCPEEDWSYDDGPEKFKRMPPQSAFRKAFDQKSPTIYRRIYSYGAERLADIKRAIAAGHLVSFGTDVTVDFTGQISGTEPLAPPSAGQAIAGGHAMCFCAYDGDVFTVVNSWGHGWGDDGFCRFSKEYVTWDRTGDLWTVEHSPNFSGG